MNKFLVFCLLAFAVITFQACELCKEPLPQCGESLINVQAKATFGSEPLVLFTDYDYPQGYKLKITRADFMINGLVLEGLSKSLTYNDSVFILQFTEDNLEKAKLGQTIKFDTCGGDFHTLNFNIGVGAETNKKNPSDFPPGHPLANAFYYWDAWKSFIFMKIEGKYDKDGDGNFEGNFAYHIGTDLFSKYALPVSLHATTGDLNKLELNFDIKRILASETDFIDIPMHPASHNPGDTAVAHKLFDNLAKAVTVK